MEYTVNQIIKLPFTSAGLVTGLTSFSGTFLVNGVVNTVTPTFSEVGGGLYTCNFTPVSTGKWCVFIEQKLYEFDIVSKTLQNALGDVLDQALGSWTWDKRTGLLTLFKSDSSVLATYQVSDTPQDASRERLT